MIVKTRNEKTVRRLNFQAYGVNLGVSDERETYLTQISKRLDEVLPNGYELIAEDKVEYLLEATHGADGGFQISRGGEVLIAGGAAADFIDSAISQIRLTVAEFAEGAVFLHAGVVGWRGRAVIIPASSFAGKTTLVAELIKNGAVYYSDEYAVLDADGLVYPYPKKLSMRGIIDDYRQTDVTAASFGAQTGTAALPVGMILISRFDNNEKPPEFNLEILSSGQGMIEVLAHSISIRRNPKFVLKVLNKVTSRAIIAKSQRGEAKLFVARLIEYLNTKFAATPEIY